MHYRFAKHWEENASKETWANKTVAWNIWQEKQAKIDELIYKAKLRESDHQALLVKYQATKKCWEDMGKKCESLKAQLNNIETCYIEKKQQIHGLHTLILNWRGLKIKGIAPEHRAYEKALGDCADQLEQSMRGANA